MAISFPATPTVTGNTSGNTVVLTKPTGVSDGDVLIAYLRSSTSGATGEFALSGWSKAAPTSFTASDAASRLHGWYYKVIPSAAAETATSYTFTFVGTAGRTTGQMFIARGVDNVTPIQLGSPNYDATPATNGGTMPSITATAAGTLLVGGGNEVVSPNADTATTPAGFTFIALSESTSGTGATRSTTSTYSQALASSGATGTVTVVWLSVSGVSVDGLILNPSSTPAVSGSLGITLGLTGAALAVVAGSLGLTLGLTGTAIPIVTGQLPLTIGATGTAKPIVTGTIPLTLGMTGKASAIATGTLGLQLGFSGTATPVVTGSLGLTLGFTGTAVSVAPAVTGSLGISLGLTGTARAIVTGSLGVSLGFTGTAVNPSTLRDITLTETPLPERFQTTGLAERFTVGALTDRFSVTALPDRFTVSPLPDRFALTSEVPT